MIGKPIPISYPVLTVASTLYLCKGRVNIAWDFPMYVHFFKKIICIFGGRFVRSLLEEIWVDLFSVIMVFSIVSFCLYFPFSEYSLLYFFSGSHNLSPQKMRFMMFMQIVHRILELTSEFFSKVEVVDQRDDGMSINCSWFVCLLLLLLLLVLFYFIYMFQSTVRLWK